MLELTHRTIKRAPRRQQATGSHRDDLVYKVPLIEVARILSEHGQHRVDVCLGVLSEPGRLE
jgi:recombinational DNA repair ATPase RecF